jgi:hypothetical protein
MGISGSPDARPTNPSPPESANKIDNLFSTGQPSIFNLNAAPLVIQLSWSNVFF